MRTFFLLLVLGNLAFFAWERYLRTTVNAQEHIQQVQITPEKIRLVAPPALASPAAPSIAKAAAGAKGAACLEWGTFIGPEAVRADAAIAELGLPAAQIRRVISDLDGHWVVIPPLKSRAEADKVAERLKGLGVTDYSIVLDPLLRRNAVSLGIFRSEEPAQILLAALQKKGVTDAVIERREGFFRRVMYYVREPNDSTVAKLSALRVAMPGTEVKAVSCPVP
jgi:hypothetical protein